MECTNYDFTNLKHGNSTQKMESQQMVELLLKEIRAAQEKADAMREEIRTNQTKAEVGDKEFLADWKAW
jgi:hypothetical protein